MVEPLRRQLTGWLLSGFGLFCVFLIEAHKIYVA